MTDGRRLIAGGVVPADALITLGVGARQAMRAAGNPELQGLGSGLDQVAGMDAKGYVAAARMMALDERTPAGPTLERRRLWVRADRNRSERLAGVRVKAWGGRSAR